MGALQGLCRMATEPVAFLTLFHYVVTIMAALDVAQLFLPRFRRFSTGRGRARSDSAVRRTGRVRGRVGICEVGPAVCAVRRGALEVRLTWPRVWIPSHITAFLPAPRWRDCLDPFGSQ